MTIQPFTIDVPQSTLDDLQTRLERTRWPDQVDGAGWDYGANLDYLKELVAYWQNGFDWRAQEAKLNEFAHFRADIDGFDLHFIHERGKGPNPQPLLLLHGWPDSFFRFYKIIPMLADPARFGGDPANSFDVVVPSLAGFGFSDRPQERGWDNWHRPEMYAQLMTSILGYERFGVHGGDTGSPLAQALAQLRPDMVVGMHLTDIGYDKVMQIDASTFTEAEQAYANYVEQWSYAEGAYFMIQGTKPQTLAYGLNDSPTGLAAWIIEKFRSWSDCDGEIERRFTKDELLTNVMIYWVTETINSSIRGYYEGMNAEWDDASGKREAEADRQRGETSGEERWNAQPAVPVGLALFPADAPAPREMAERFFNLQRFTEMARGGHFAALEEPELLVDDLRAFFKPLR